MPWLGTPSMIPPMLIPARLIRFAASVGMTILLAACAVPPVREASPSVSADPTPLGESDPESIKFARAENASPVPAGFNVQFGWLCERGGRRQWQQLSPLQYSLLFASSIRPWGFKVDETSNSLFDDPDSGSDLQIGALIESAEANLCFPFSGRPTLDVGRPDIVKGNALMAVRWEIYSRSRKQVVHTLRTESSISLPDTVHGGARGIYARLFSENVQRLASDPGFRRLVTRQRPAA